MPRHHYWAGERERRRTAYCAQSLGALNAFAALVSRFSLSRFPHAFSLFLLIAVSCVVFLCLYSAAFASLCCACFTFPLTTCCNCATVQFQTRFDATLVSLWLPVFQSSRTCAKLWFHLTNGQAINHKIKKTQVLANRKRRRLLRNGSVWALAWPKGNCPMGQRLGESNSQIKRDLIWLFTSLSLSLFALLL